jgi:hypothetical protein
MMSKTPEDIEALRKKYAADNAAKQKAKKDKKAKFAEQNAAKNMPVVEYRIPLSMAWRDVDGKFYIKDIDINKEPWCNGIQSAEHQYRFNIWLETEIWPIHEVRVKIVRTESDQEKVLRRLYGDNIIFIER